MPKKNNNTKKDKNNRIVFNDSDSDDDTNNENQNNKNNKVPPKKSTPNNNNTKKDGGERVIFNDTDTDDDWYDQMCLNEKNRNQNKNKPQPKNTQNNANNKPNNANNKQNNRRREREESPPPIKPAMPTSLAILLNTINNNKNNKYDCLHYMTIKNNCTNPLCDHLFFSKNPITVSTISYIDNIQQLIELGETYHCRKNKTFNNINLRVLYELIEPLSKLQQMIGLTEIKNKVVDQVLYFLQGYHNGGVSCGTCYDCDNDIPCMKNQSDMLHMVVTGKPGVGKTEFAKCVGKIYQKLGILTNDKFKIYTRADLVGEYLGHTAVKTQKCIDECKGGVMFIDEVYSLGNTELKDSFAKECIDMLNLNLSERRDFLCIIAGYKEAVDDCFFKYNEGLNRRFPFRYDIPPYKWNELKEIFELKVKVGGFQLHYDIGEENVDNKKVQELFRKNKDNFPNGGGDMETLFLKCKIVHSRTISTTPETKYVLSYADIEKGVSSLIESRNNNNDNNFHELMYM